jgi:hypothetical protein
MTARTGKRAADHPRREQLLMALFAGSIGSRPRRGGRRVGRGAHRGRVPAAERAPPATGRTGRQVGHVAFRTCTGGDTADRAGAVGSEDRTVRGIGGHGSGGLRSLPLIEGRRRRYRHVVGIRVRADGRPARSVPVAAAEEPLQEPATACARRKHDGRLGGPFEKASSGAEKKARRAAAEPAGSTRSARVAGARGRYVHSRVNYIVCLHWPEDERSPFSGPDAARALRSVPRTV